MSNATKLQIPTEEAAAHWLFDLFCVSFVSFHLSNIPSHTSPSAVRVDDSVSLQMMHQDEGFPAQRAAVGPLPAVRALVDPQTALLRKPLPALSAAVRLLARVCPVVYAEVG